MSLTPEQALGHRLMLSFSGTQPSAEILALLQRHPIGGVTLFRKHNAESPAQVRALTAALQQAARNTGQPPLLIGADQEGGTLIALPGTTPFPGNLALGATRSSDLAYRAGYAMGRELAALGVNVNYAPVCDVNINPKNSVVGPRSFGEDPALVAQLAAAMVSGLQAAGIAAAPKHFPGHGDTDSDSHYGTPVMWHDAARLRQVELPPFLAAVRAGARMMLTAHIALPNFNAGSAWPATLSAPILRGLLRDELGFEGVIVSDALDMRAIEQGPALIVECLAALRAGVDLLLLTTYTDQAGIAAGLLQAVHRDLLPTPELMTSAARILALKEWVSRQVQPPLEVVNSAEHRALAAEIADKSITLVRDTAGLLPLRLAPQQRLVVVLPEPQDLTPADTSSYEQPQLAHLLRQRHALVDEHRMSLTPSEADIRAMLAVIPADSLVIVGTINAATHLGQAALVNALIQQGHAVVAVALRMPYDVVAYPAVSTYLCTYSLQPASLEALGRVLWGEQPALGQLPATFPEPITKPDRFRAIND